MSHSDPVCWPRCNPRPVYTTPTYVIVGSIGYSSYAGIKSEVYDKFTDGLKATREFARYKSNSEFTGTLEFLGAHPSICGVIAR